MTEPEVRHDCKFSESVKAKLLDLVNNEDDPIEGPLVDPFCGVTGLGFLDRDWYGIEIEKEWAAVHGDRCKHGDALHSWNYHPRPGAGVTSIVYPNRMTGNYLGPKCRTCKGSGRTEPVGHEEPGQECPRCLGSGHDGKGRMGYAISLGRRLTDGNIAATGWTQKWRDFHVEWLRTMASVMDPGQRRLIVNVSDQEHQESGRVYVVQWLIGAAQAAGFNMADCWPVDTPRMRHGANHENRAEREYIVVFDLGVRAV